MSLPILIDCDGVLADFDSACARLARHYKVDVGAKDMIQWNWLDAHWPAWRDAVTRDIQFYNFCERLSEYSGAIAWLRDVEATFGADRVCVCTSPWNAEWARQRAAWLERRGVPMKRQIQMSAKQLIPGYLIDDAIHNIEARPAYTAGFLLAQPWNKDGAGVYPRGDHAAALQWLKEVAK